MKDLVWVGIRESEVKYSNFIDDSISIFGNNVNCLEKQIKKRINHNNEMHFTFIDDFYNKEVIKQIEKNPNIKFMYYSQIYSYDSMKKLGLLDHVLCLNNQELIEFVNNKFRTKNLLKDYIPILDYIIMNGKDCNFENLKRKYDYDEFVIQTANGSGGFSTIVLNENNKNDIKLDSNQTYMVTKYCKNNIPVNIHILISKNDITLLPPSIQNIELSHNRLMYKGSDFITYKEFIDDKMDLKLKKYAIIVGKLMQKKGYRGILGIDSIIYDGEVYFMEINPRFQNSSTLLNKALQENNLPSIQELQYNCFYNKPIKLKHFDVKYSSYINEYGAGNKKFEIEPIEILDKFNENIECEYFSYLSTDIYDKPIMKRNKIIMNKELIQNHIKEKNTQGFTNKKFDTFFDGKVLQICFYSKGCRFSKNGNCIMCDYGKSRKENLNPTDIKEIMQETFTNLKQHPKVLLLNSLGSVLDELEMPKENIMVILDEISKVNIDVIIFETHYSSINEDILQLIKHKLSKKQIEIELGFESSNPEYRQNYLNKIIDNDQFVEKVNLIKSYGFTVETNVIFGMPYLTTKEQIKDTVQSIIWCFQNNIDGVNLFPMNIKPYTLLYKLYETGEYSPVNHKDFIEVLKQIPREYIDRIYLCWYGNRELYYDGKQTILPICNENEYDKIMKFYKDFNLHKDREYREDLLNNMKL